MKKTLLLTVALVALLTTARGQQPCRDTVVHFTDSVCEGLTYRFGNRTIDHYGVYYDTLKRLGTDCDSVSILHLFVLDSVRISFFKYPQCHEPYGYRLAAASSATRYRWSSQPADSSMHTLSGPFIVHIAPQQPTAYTVVCGYGPAFRCSDSASVTVNPLQPVVPRIEYTPSELDYDRPVVTLHDLSTGNRSTPYGGWCGRNWIVNGQKLPLWQPDITFDALTSALADGVSPPDSLRIVLQPYSPTCADSVVVVIPFRKDPVYIPNVFTPDADADNRFLPVVGAVSSYQLCIFNRQGIMVFRSSDPDTPWDGTLATLGTPTPCPQGVYHYRLRFSPAHSPSTLRTLAGTVLLLR